MNDIDSCSFSSEFLSDGFIRLKNIVHLLFCSTQERQGLEQIVFFEWTIPWSFVCSIVSLQLWMLLSLSLQASRVKSSSFFTLWSADHFLHFFVVPVELWSSEIFWCLPLKSGYICLLSVENRETDHKAHYAGSTLCVFVFLAPS